MCGICGFLKTENSAKQYSVKQIQIMNNKMIHRGPDGEGAWVSEDGMCGLGHRRLSIIDLSEDANQPMSSDNGRIQVVFNGEIYNHREIRAELEKTGQYVWKTDHSDTEVVVHAYEQWGLDCLDKFRGMFAIAIWDARKEKMILIRDRMGIKPLYYTFDENTLVFASEIKALLPLLSHKPVINEKALYDYLSFLCAPGEKTLFEGIYKLRPASWLTCDKKKNIYVNQYYEILDHIQTGLEDASEQEIKNRIIQELQMAVDLRKEADVPVGVFLSGGIDSSTNAALFAQNTSTKVKTFCIGYQWEGNECVENENAYARQMADFCGAEYFEKFITKEEWLDVVPEIIRLQDEPIADPTCASSYYVARLARENGVIVGQVGEGADELFCGYPNWLRFIKSSKVLRGPIPKIIKKSVMDQLYRGKYANSIRSEVIRRNLKDQPVFWSGAEAFYEYEKRMLISPKLNRWIGTYTSFEAIEPAYKRFCNSSGEKSDLTWMGYVDLCHRLPELLLMRVDKMSMGVSLESRVPFLDHKLVELSMGIPQHMKIKGNITKYILKEAVRSVIPDEVIDRKKSGFATPVYNVFMNGLADEMKQEVLHFISETGLLNQNYVLEMVEKGISKNKMWYLYNLAMWYKEYIA